METLQPTWSEINVQMFYFKSKMFRKFSEWLPEDGLAPYRMKWLNHYASLCASSHENYKVNKTFDSFIWIRIPKLMNSRRTNCLWLSHELSQSHVSIFLSNACKHKKHPLCVVVNNVYSQTAFYSNDCSLVLIYSICVFWMDSSYHMLTSASPLALFLSRSSPNTTHTVSPIAVVTFD